MIRRLAALAFSLVFLSAPVVGTMCQMVCAAHVRCGATEAELAPAAHEHHHHGAAMPAPSSAAFRSAPHACDHRSDEAPGVQQVTEVIAAPVAIAVEWFSFDSASFVAAGVHPVDLTPSPPNPLSLTAQLRV